MKGHKRDPQGEKWAEGLTDDTFKISLTNMIKQIYFALI